MSEKLCLQWNDFKENTLSTFESLKEDKDFTDVTLVCGDGKQIEVHKMILANSSPFFQNILRKNKHIHPLIFMRGVKSIDLLAIVDFLYCGEANVYQENLDSFLAIAEEFQLKGLSGEIDEEKVKEENLKPRIFNQNTQKQYQPKQTGSNDQRPRNEIESDIFKKSDNVVAIPEQFSGDFAELDEKVNSMMEKSENSIPTRYTCKMCGKEGMRNDIRKHIESNHLEGVCIPCNFCEKTFRSRKLLREHKLKYHRF